MPDLISHNEQILAQAIIMQAVRDWRAARWKLSVNPNNRFAASDIYACERFFRSAWFQRLTTADGEWILRCMREEIPRKPSRGKGHDCLSMGGRRAPK